MNRKLPRWPLIPVALSAMVSIWGGWVSLGALTGFGVVHLLPQTGLNVTINLALTLPVSVEAYAAYALAAWLGPWKVTARARRFAMCSALGALVLGALGQVSYHLLAAEHARRAPDAVTVAVACVPVVVIAFGAALHHLMTHSRDVATGDTAESRASFWENPVGAAIAARIAPRPATDPATLPAVRSDTEDDAAHDAESDTEAPPEATAAATPAATGELPATRQEPRQPQRRQGARKAPAWHAKARRLVAKDSTIAAADLAAKCGVNVRSAQRYLAEHPPLIHAVQDSKNERTEAS